MTYTFWLTGPEMHALDEVKSGQRETLTVARLLNKCEVS